MSAEADTLVFPFQSVVPLELPDEYINLREHEPVVRVSLPTGDRAWLVTRYDDVRQVYADSRFSRAAATRSGAPRCNEVAIGPDSIFSKDPPEHTRLRRLVAPAFTVRRIAAMRARIQRLVDAFLDSMEEAGPPADLVTEIALPLPLTVICELLGIPQADRGRFRAWSEVFMSTTRYPVEEVREAQARFERYFAALITHKRAHPTDDLLGVLIAARDEDENLTEEELINLGIVLLVTGFETTYTQISNIVFTLLRHPDQLARLRQDLDLVPAAIEELMRYIPRRADGGTIRVALEDIELGGITVRAGEAVIPAINSANRDDRRFPEADRLDLTRSDTSHLAFGFGTHHCLGAQLARLELQVTLNALLRRFPRLSLAVAEQDLLWRTGTLSLSPLALPVAW
jgi:cytochrome P450